MEKQVAILMGNEVDRRVVVTEDGNGHFRWYEEAFVTLDETPEGGVIYEYWSSVWIPPGLYSNAADAIADAKAHFDWLRASAAD
ncbi:hypothetical protein LZK98_02530 [Sphingomonas cannabina]|uniref:hypothetical protein n=1 Tax=Sphingomonas cannabina TaxID=2899123 RepID=UPI001F405439|nr:hypothetical protein [Sphingomonas cannabina]UIJ45855.1 hypothetical protein LZK98_02530 [Sphingomonas cannabina]